MIYFIINMLFLICGTLSGLNIGLVIAKRKKNIAHIQHVIDLQKQVAKSRENNKALANHYDKRITEARHKHFLLGEVLADTKLDKEGCKRIFKENQQLKEEIKSLKQSNDSKEDK